MDPAIVYMKPQRSPYDMESLYSGCTGIDDHHVPLRITHDLQDMGMAAYEYVRLQLVYEPARPRIVSSGISADVGHENVHTLAFEEAVQRMGETQVVVVTIACNAFERLECSDLIRQFKSAAEVPGMPDLVHRPKKLLERFIEDTVGVRYQTYEHIKD